MIITSKNNPFIKETASLKDKKGRKALSLFLVEGEKMTKECISSGMSIERVIVSESYSGFTPDDAVVVSDDVFRIISDEITPQGILCRVHIPDVTPKIPKNSCLLLDGVSDPGNMGTIIRTANASGYNEIYLTGCVDPFSPKCVRASMSGIFFTNVYISDKETVLETLKDVPIISADMAGENIFTFVPPEKFVLAIGNEANGISEEVFNHSKYRVKIPMEPTQESLNAGVSAGIAMYLLKKEKFTINK